MLPAVWKDLRYERPALWWTAVVAAAVAAAAVAFGPLLLATTTAVPDGQDVADGRAAALRTALEDDLDGALATLPSWATVTADGLPVDGVTTDEPVMLTVDVTSGVDVGCAQLQVTFPADWVVTGAQDGVTVAGPLPCSVSLDGAAGS